MTPVYSFDPGMSALSALEAMYSSGSPGAYDSLGGQAWVESDRTYAAGYYGAQVGACWPVEPFWSR